jgi:ribonuclease HI
VVRLMWVPAHVSIDGNEMVDRIAKESAASGICIKVAHWSVTCALR